MAKKGYIYKLDKDNNKVRQYPYTKCECVLDLDSYLGDKVTNMEDVVSYGIQYDVTDPLQNCTRIGNLSYHKTLPIQSKMRGCLLNSDGEVVKYLDENDWSDEDLSGESGNVMVEIPTHYRKFSQEGNIITVRISTVSLDGYVLVPLHYVGAYEATLYRAKYRLASVCNKDEEYRGGYRGDSSFDDAQYSLLGKPVTEISQDDFRTYARNINTSDKGWNIRTYDSYLAVYWLFAIEYATLNSQADYNSELDGDGFHQGGLGMGVTQVGTDFWKHMFDGTHYYPFVDCGYTNEFGNNTGVKELTLTLDGYDDVTVYVPRYRGIENIFGHIYEIIDGICLTWHYYFNESGEIIGMKLDKLIKHNPTNFVSMNINDIYDILESYETQETTFTVNQGIIQTIGGGKYGDIVPTNVASSSNQYYYDYYYYCYYYGESEPEGSVFILLMGGSADINYYAGLGCMNALYTNNHVGDNIGTRICYFPNLSLFED